MRLMADAIVTVYCQGKEMSDTVRVEFDDAQFKEFDFGKFFADMIRKLDPALIDAYPKERITFDIRRIHRTVADQENITRVYSR